MGVTGLNHVTLAVRDLDRSIAFYRDVLGCRLRAVWADGAYFAAGPLWLCLSREEARAQAPSPDDTHLAFSVAEADYPALRARVIATCRIWRENRSEGASTYFLDPDGHKLELHLGTLDTRLAHYRADPAKSVTVLDF